MIDIGTFPCDKCWMQSPEAICKSVVRRSASNFTASFMFVDAQQRRAMRALYAFCRVIDDIVDEPGDAECKEAQLAAWTERVAQLNRGEAPLSCSAGDIESAIHSELAWVREHFDLQTCYLQDLIDGMQFDLKPAYIANYDELLRYCYGVAGTVGLSCLSIFRVEDTAQSKAAGLALANAFQLTNILRDVQGDAEMGRCYIPADDMQQFELSPEDFLHDFHPSYTRARVQELVMFYVQRAEEFYEKAWKGFAEDDFLQLRPARVMSDYYYTILQAIKRDPLCVLRGRTSVSFVKKGQVLLRAWSAQRGR